MRNTPVIVKQDWEPGTFENGASARRVEPPSIAFKYKMPLWKRALLFTVGIFLLGVGIAFCILIGTVIWAALR